MAAAGRPAKTFGERMDSIHWPKTTYLGEAALYFGTLADAAYRNPGIRPLANHMPNGFVSAGAFAAHFVKDWGRLVGSLTRIGMLGMAAYYGRDALDAWNAADSNYVLDYVDFATEGAMSWALGIDALRGWYTLLKSAAPAAGAGAGGAAAGGTGAGAAGAAGTP